MCCTHVHVKLKHRVRYQGHQWDMGLQSETDDSLYHSRLFVSFVQEDLLSGSLHTTICFLVSTQWKHAFWDGKSLAWHFSCCGQRFPWQVSLNAFHWYAYFPVSSLTFFILLFFVKGLDWNLMTRSSLKTNTKPCESILHWDTTCLCSVKYLKPNKAYTGHSYLLLPSWHCELYSK